MVRSPARTQDISFNIAELKQAMRSLPVPIKKQQELSCYEIAQTPHRGLRLKSMDGYMTGTYVLLKGESEGVKSATTLLDSETLPFLMSGSTTTLNLRIDDKKITNLDTGAWVYRTPGKLPKFDSFTASNPNIELDPFLSELKHVAKYFTSNDPKQHRIGSVKLTKKGHTVQILATNGSAVYSHVCEDRGAMGDFEIFLHPLVIKKILPASKLNLKIVDGTLVAKILSRHDICELIVPTEKLEFPLIEKFLELQGSELSIGKIDFVQTTKRIKMLQPKGRSKQSIVCLQKKNGKTIIGYESAKGSVEFDFSCDDYDAVPMFFDVEQFRRCCEVTHTMIHQNHPHQPVMFYTNQTKILLLPVKL